MAEHQKTCSYYKVYEERDRLLLQIQEIRAMEIGGHKVGDIYDHMKKRNHEPAYHSHCDPERRVSGCPKCESK